MESLARRTLSGCGRPAALLQRPNSCVLLRQPGEAHGSASLSRPLLNSWNPLGGEGVRSLQVNAKDKRQAGGTPSSTSAKPKDRKKGAAPEEGPLWLKPDDLGLHGLAERLRELATLQQGPSEGAETIRMELENHMTRIANMRSDPQAHLLMDLLRACARWDLQLPEETLAEIEQVLERLARAELCAKFKSLDKKLSMRLQNKAAPPAYPDEAGMTHELMEGAILPLTRLGQHLRHPDLLALALCAWRTQVEPYKGLDASKAASILTWAAEGPTRRLWPGVPLLREELEKLIHYCFSEDTLLDMYGSAKELAGVMLSSAKALRILSEETKQSAGHLAPQAYELFPAAVEWLLEVLEPGVGEMAAAMQALFVDLDWGAEQDKLPASARLPSLLEAATSSQRGGGSPESYQQMLAACARCRPPPPPPALARLYAATYDVICQQSVPADALLGIIRSIAAIEGVCKETALEARAAVGSPPGGNDGTASQLEARQAVLEAAASHLLSAPLLSVLKHKPDRLVEAVQDLVAVGVQLPASWVQRYADAVFDCLSPSSKGLKLSAAGLSAAAETLAGLGAALPACGVSAIMHAAAERAATHEHRKAGWVSYGVQELGILLGSVHVLLSLDTAEMPATPARSGSKSGPQSCNSPPGLPELDERAQQAWEEAHAVFAAQSHGVLSGYSSTQLHMVLAAILSYESVQCGLHQRLQATGSNVAGSPAGRGDRPQTSHQQDAEAMDKDVQSYTWGPEAKGSASRTPSVDIAWLHECALSLLKKQCPPGGHLSAAAPPTILVVGVLELAANLLSFPANGLVGDGVSEKGQGSGKQASAASAMLQALNKFVSAYSSSKRELTTAAGRQSEMSGGERAMSAAAVRPASKDDGLILDAWQGLLTAALQAGVKPDPHALSAYCSLLFASLAEMSSSSEASTPLQQKLWRATESALSDVLLPVLPWAPGREMARGFVEGLVLQAPLQHASSHQLGLLATYCTQAGLGADTRVWDRLQSEFLLRLNEASSAGAAMAGALPEVAIPRLSRNELKQISAADLAAVDYGVLMSGGSLSTPLIGWLQQLPTGVQVLPSALAGHQSHPFMANISALQQLWVAASCGELAKVPEGLWSDMLNGVDVVLAMLLPQQLGQVVMLCAAFHDAERIQDLIQPQTADTLLKALARQKQAQVDSQQPGLEPAVVAAAAVRCLVPAAVPAGQKLPPHVLALVHIAVPSFITLPLRQLKDALQVLVERTGWSMQPQQVDLVVHRATRLQLADANQQETHATDNLSMCEALQLTSALVTLGPQSAEGINLVVPLLDRIMPSAEATLKDIVLKEQLDNTVFDGDGSGGPAAAAPAAAAAALVSALIAAGGTQQIPRSAAASFHLLLTINNVVSLVGVTKLEQALLHNICDHDDLPMSDIVALTIIDHERDARNTSLISLFLVLRNCGLSKRLQLLLLEGINSQEDPHIWPMELALQLLAALLSIARQEAKVGSWVAPAAAGPACTP